jgi:muramoyltetrapeptide carboxypeptidase
VAGRPVGAVWPPGLREGGHIRVVAPAGRLGEGLEASAQWFRRLGYQVSFGTHISAGHGYLSAQDAARADDLNQAIQDPAVDAILAARGGYGSMRILPAINWASWRHRPRLFLGFSDCTAILAALVERAGLVALHGPMFLDTAGWTGDSGIWALKALRREGGPLHPDPMTSIGRVDGEGIEGRLIGGNLSLVAALLGTPWSWKFSGSLLYLEEVGEAPYRVDRLLMQLRLAGVFDQVRAVIFGEAWGCEGPPGRAGFSVETVIAEALGNLAIPAWVGLPAGHGPFKVTLPMGAVVRIEGGRLVLPTGGR